MAHRNVVTILAALGGILVVLGGILGFLLSLGAQGFGPRFEGGFGALLMGAIAVVLGLIILVFSGYTHYRGVERSLVGGLILIVLGVVTWVVVGDWILVALGAVRPVRAGLVLLAQLQRSATRPRPSSGASARWRDTGPRERRCGGLSGPRSASRTGGRAPPGRAGPHRRSDP